MEKDTLKTDNMKIKKKCLSTKLMDLYGNKDYKSHIEVGREYWYYFDKGTPIFEATQEHWNKLRVTYIRSGCMFYDFPDAADVPEEFLPISCFMAANFIFAEIDPTKDLDDKTPELSKLIYYFDDERTVVKNWPNQRETEINEEEIMEKFGDYYHYLKMFENYGQDLH